MTVELSETVIHRLAQQRQTSRRHVEAGGQVFGQIEHRLWRIEACTGPRPTDMRSPCGYAPNPEVENAEIVTMYDQGLHFLGDWHTHFQKVPAPSRQDITTTQRCYRRATTALPGFLLIIVGRTFPYHPCRIDLVTGNKVHNFQSIQHTAS